MQKDAIGRPENDDGHKNATDAGSTKVTFTAEQQTKVQELIDDAYRKAYSKAHRATAPAEEVERMSAEIDGLKREKKKLELMKAISRYNVVDAEEIAELMESRVRMDEAGNISIVNRSGSRKINESGHPMGMEEYLGEWLSARPHHLRVNGATGAGSRGAGFRASGAASYSLTDPSSWQRMPREDLDRFMREGIDVYGSAGQVYRFKDVKNPFLDARKRRFRSSAG